MQFDAVVKGVARQLLLVLYAPIELLKSILFFDKSLSAITCKIEPSIVKENAVLKAT